MQDTELLDAVVAAVKTLRPMPGMSETDIHEQVKEALSRAGLDFSHEVRLGPRSRIDFMVGGIGIELKKGGAQRARLIAQLRKYAQSDRVTALILLVGHGVSVPKAIDGKPCVVITLGALWGLTVR